MQAPPADWRIIAITASITTLIAAVVGFVSAMFIDVVKSIFSDRRKQRRLRHALYVEMSSLYSKIETILAVSEHEDELEISTGMFELIDTPVYDAAISEPTDFYQMGEAVQIRQLYELLRIAAKGEEKETMLICCDHFKQVFETKIEKRRLNVKLLKKIIPDTVRKILTTSDAQATSQS